MMAVAEITEPAKKKMDKSDNGESGRTSKASAGALSGAASWPVRKWNELVTFFGEVRTELKKVTWPAKQEVYSTTIVIVATTVFFGFYLWFVDLACTKLLTQMLRQR
jgi:preprotein translocase subunit SecE